MAEIVVVGSANLDIVVPVPHHPVGGETVLGGDHRQIPGGKGANQAIAASRLGRDVGFIGAVGADGAGSALRDALVQSGVDVSGLLELPGPSGIALISVDESGENSIVVSPGANAKLTPAHVASAPDLADAAIVLLQLETPIETVRAAVAKANGTTVLNPAPAQSLPADLFEHIDLVVPNEIELAMIAGVGQTLDSIDAVEAAASTLPCSVVVTLGSRGCLVVTEHETTHVPAPQITPVDTTAAGDSFCGALADALVRGADLTDAARWAVRVGAATALEHGASSSLPTPEQVADRLS